MSRIGKQPVSIPSGMDVSLNGAVLSFKKGNVTKELDTNGWMVWSPSSNIF